MVLLSPENVRTELADFAKTRTEAIIERFFPDLTIPGFFGGYHIYASERANLAFTLTYLAKLGISEIAGYPLQTALSTIIRGIDGPRTDTFYSYRIAETLLAFGPFEDNPLLADFTPAERENIAQACDSSHIYRQNGLLLGGRPSNYWAVLARCEYGRQRLGILDNTALLDEAFEQVNAIAFNNPLGYFDDGHGLHGRYDIYSADTYLFLEPLWSRLDADKLEHSLRQHVALLEALAMENGAFVFWGRSLGALSLCLTMEMGALGLRLGYAKDSGRLLGLVQNALTQYQNWFQDDLITAHRHKMTYQYRGPFRLLEMCTDNLAKLAYTADQLQQAQQLQPVEVEPALPAQLEVGLLFPSRDTLIPLHETGAAVWMFRNEHIAFQFALVNHVGADYGPWFHSPGLLEVPVDTTLMCGLPRLVNNGVEYTCRGLPVETQKTENGLKLLYEGFLPVQESDPSVDLTGALPLLPGKRTVEYRINQDQILAQEKWIFDQRPDAIGFHIPQRDRPLNLTIDSETPFHHHQIAVDGMTPWRSFWGEFRILHEVNFIPQDEIQFSYTLRPKLQVVTIPGDHDYVRALYDSMPPERIVQQGLTWFRSPNEMNLALLGDVDILHLGWPENLFLADGMAEAEFDEKLLAFLEAVGRSPIRVVWTMHNRLPHKFQNERGKHLYQACAAIADGVIHHSQWGMEQMRAELHYKPSAHHVVIPHGHYGSQMPRLQTRSQLEADWGLPPCTMRFGVLGRAQPEKRVDLILQAFHRAGRPDQQLLVNAITPDTIIPDDPRIIVLENKHHDTWLAREEIGRLLQVCDGLVSAHQGPSYLTSGLVADAIGMGIPMLVPKWPFYQEILGKAGLEYSGDEMNEREAGLRMLFAEITPAQLAAGKEAAVALQEKYAWPKLAQQTIALFERIGCALR
ncbi:MAG: glycosyltransferase [Chloroflexota bacterium]